MAAKKARFLVIALSLAAFGWMAWVPEPSMSQDAGMGGCCGPTTPPPQQPTPQPRRRSPDGPGSGPGGGQRPPACPQGTHPDRDGLCVSN